MIDHLNNTDAGAGTRNSDPAAARVRCVPEDSALTQTLVSPSVFGRPARAEEIVQAVPFLASDDTLIMTCSEVMVDEGFTAV